MTIGFCVGLLGDPVVGGVEAVRHDDAVDQGVLGHAEVGVGDHRHRHLAAEGDAVDLVLYRAGVGVDEDAEPGHRPKISAEDLNLSASIGPRIASARLAGIEVGSDRGETGPQARAEQGVGEVGGGFVGAGQAVIFGGGAFAEVAVLGEDEPHPVAALLPRLQFGERGFVDAARLRFDEACKIIGVWAAAACLAGAGKCIHEGPPKLESRRLP